MLDTGFVMRLPLVLFTVLVVLLLSGGWSAAGGGYRDATAPGFHRCHDAVEQRLSRYGISLDQMSNIRWDRDTFAREGSYGELSGYRFYGRPATCTGGDIAISLWPNCGIQQIRARGECAVPNLNGC